MKQIFLFLFMFAAGKLLGALLGLSGDVEYAAHFMFDVVFFMLVFVGIKNFAPNLLPPFKGE